MTVRLLDLLCHGKLYVHAIYFVKLKSMLLKHLVKQPASVELTL